MKSYLERVMLPSNWHIDPPAPEPLFMQSTSASANPTSLSVGFFLSKQGFKTVAEGVPPKLQKLGSLPAGGADAFTVVLWNWE